MKKTNILAAGICTLVFSCSIQVFADLIGSGEQSAAGEPTTTSPTLGSCVLSAQHLYKVVTDAEPKYWPVIDSLTDALNTPSCDKKSGEEGEAIKVAYAKLAGNAFDYPDPNDTYCGIDQTEGILKEKVRNVATAVISHDHHFESDIIYSKVFTGPNKMKDREAYINQCNAGINRARIAGKQVTIDKASGGTTPSDKDAIADSRPVYGGD